jgi:hypothetical protein
MTQPQCKRIQVNINDTPVFIDTSSDTTSSANGFVVSSDIEQRKRKRREAGKRRQNTWRNKQRERASRAVDLEQENIRLNVDIAVLGMQLINHQIMLARMYYHIITHTPIRFK